MDSKQNCDSLLANQRNFSYGTMGEYHTLENAHSEEQIQLQLITIRDEGRFILMALAAQICTIAALTAAYYVDFDPWPDYYSDVNDNISWCLWIIIGLIVSAALTNVLKKDLFMLLSSPILLSCILIFYCFAISFTVAMSTHLICSYYKITQDSYDILCYTSESFVLIFCVLIIYCLPKNTALTTSENEPEESQACENNKNNKK